jgi:two-component system sensor histidine kinase KdpD
MVANLLDMNRLDAGAVVVRPAPVGAADLVLAALERAGPALAGRKLANAVGPGAPRLLADAALAETALANVLQNAGKYAPKGGAVRIRAGAEAGEGWIEVTDEGPGFAGAIEPMFEKFSRGVEGDGRPPGTGLGLSIARGFLEAQGGRIEAANLPGGKGARVRLTLPLARVAEPA